MIRECIKTGVGQESPAEEGTGDENIADRDENSPNKDCNKQCLGSGLLFVLLIYQSSNMYNICCSGRDVHGFLPLIVNDDVEEDTEEREDEAGEHPDIHQLH